MTSIPRDLGEEAAAQKALRDAQNMFPSGSTTARKRHVSVCSVRAPKASAKVIPPKPKAKGKAKAKGKGKAKGKPKAKGKAKAKAEAAAAPPGEEEYSDELSEEDSEEEGEEPPAAAEAAVVELPAVAEDRYPTVYAMGHAIHCS